MKRLILNSALILFAFLLSAQDCELAIPSGSWQGKTVNSSSGVQVSAQSNTVQISDITAGLFSKYGHSGLDVSLEFDCNGNMKRKQVTSYFGPIDFTSGEWDKRRKRLTINWSIESNKIDETTTLTYSE